MSDHPDILSAGPFGEAAFTTAEIAFTLGYAAQAHHGQMYGDVPYVHHLVRVLGQVIDLGGSHEVQIAALLHDVIEDTPVTAADLLAAGFPHRSVELVLAVTKVNKGSHKPHATWIAEIIETGDAEAILLKLGDTIANHENTILLPEADPRKTRLLAKYGPARIALTEALEASRTER